MSEPDKKLLDHLKTLEELRKRGFIQVTCPHCNGMGHILAEHFHTCYPCNGRGYTMEQEKPLTRLTGGLREIRKNQPHVTWEDAVAQAKRIRDAVNRRKQNDPQP